MRKAANMKHAAKLSLAAVLLAVAVGGCSDSKPNWKWKFWEKAESVPVEFKIGEPKPAAGLEKQTVPGSDRPVYVHPKAMLTNADIASAKVVSGDNGHVIEVVFTEDGKKAFGRLTQDSINKHLVIIADGKIISAPVIKAPILGGAALIAGGFTKEQADRIAEGIMRK